MQLRQVQATTGGGLTEKCYILTQSGMPSMRGNGQACHRHWTVFGGKWYSASPPCSSARRHLHATEIETLNRSRVGLFVFPKDRPCEVIAHATDGTMPYAHCVGTETDSRRARIRRWKDGHAQLAHEAASDCRSSDRSSSFNSASSACSRSMVASRSRTIRRNETSVSGDSSRDLVASPDANLKSTTLRAAVPMAVAAAGVEAVVAKVVETVALPSGQAEALPLGVPSDGSRVVHTTAPAVSRQRSEEWIAGVVVALAVDLAVAHEADTGTDMCVQFIFALLFLASAVAVDAMTMEFEATADRSSRVEAKPVSVAPAPLRACAKSANVLCCTVFGLYALLSG